MHKSLFCCFFLLVGMMNLRAQDSRFSHLSASTQLTNPAMVGMFNGELRMTANYRELYTSFLGPEGYKSYAAGLELRRPAENGNFFGIGFQFQRDKAGESQFVRSQGLLGINYQQHIGGNRRRKTGHFLTGGAQVGFGQRGFDLSKVWFSNQYFVNDLTRESYLDRTRPSGEPLTGFGNQMYLDANAGLGWFARLGERAGAYIGLAAFHLNEPNVSPISGNTDKIDRRYVIHGGGEIPMGKGYLSLIPSARFMIQGPSREIIIGSSLRYSQRNWKEVALRVGTSVQMSNASQDKLGMNSLILNTGLETERIQFNVSYDVAVGYLNTFANGRGGWELSVIYIKPAQHRQRVICPTF